MTETIETNKTENDRFCFPVIERLSDMLPIVEKHPEFMIVKDQYNFTTITYGIITPKLFDSPLLRECRGIVFGPDGELVARPFHKFFNIGEIDYTQVHEIDFKRIVSVEEKLDGSHIYFIRHEGNWIGRTHKPTGTNGYQARAATAFLKRRPALIRLLNELGPNHTANFEYVAPNNQVLLPYKDESLVLLAVRHNSSGRYWSRDEITDFLSSRILNVPRPHNGWLPEECLEKAKTEEHKEGWVFVRDDGERYKAKTLWYHTIHRVVSHFSPKSILEAWLEGQADDMMALLRNAHRKKDIALMTSVLEEAGKRYSETVAEVNRIVRESRNEFGEGSSSALPPSALKELAHRYQGHPLFGLVMTGVRGGEIDYHKYAEKVIVPAVREMFEMDKNQEKIHQRA